MKGYAAVYYDRMDGWLVEDEPAFGHIRDPFHRVDVYASSRSVTVTAKDGTVLARSTRPKLVFETALPIRPYIPRADVMVDLAPTETHTVCAYKGDASYWSAAGLEDVAWSYETPRGEAAGLEGHVAFDPAHVEVTLG